MAKSADAFRTISEVAEWLDTPAHVLRFWESKFTQVKPVKRAGGRRYYRPQDMRLLGGIKKLLHDDGMTIKGVQKLLRENGIKHVSSLSQPLDGEEDAANTYGAGLATPAPAQVLDFRPRSNDTAAASPDATETEPDGEPPVPPQRDLTLTHIVPQNPAPADMAADPDSASPHDRNLFADDDDAATASPVEEWDGVEEDEDDEDQAQAGTEDAAEETPAPAAEADPKLPGFLSRAPEDGAPEETATPDAPPTAEQPAPDRPSLSVDVPDDPADDEFVTPGPLSMLADVPRPFTAPMMRLIPPIVKRLRNKLDETDET
ncbi:MAG: MerR family transcriptional regulator [Roseovarius sp.]|uniref:MerR family transcriptional regulator n=1 Tax=Roseovarius sp. TaxID=1486281 RepID=UPI0032EC7F5A